VYSSAGKRSPGHLSRQGPEVLRWLAYEAGKAHARASAPDHAYYAQVKDRTDGKRAAIPEAPQDHPAGLPHLVRARRRRAHHDLTRPHHDPLPAGRVKGASGAAERALRAP